MAGVAGSFALASAMWVRGVRSPSPAPSTPEEDVIVRALMMPMLGGALPARGPERDTAVAATLRNVHGAIASLPPAAQQELAELFALLATAPGRIAFAGLTSTWAEADQDALGRVLQRWRTSRLMLRRSAYAALHQLVFAAWYARPESWTAIGYPGPPELA